MDGDTDTEIDPFEDFDRQMGAAAAANPYPEWARLRAEGPVHLVDPRSVFDLPEELELGDLPPMYLVVGFDAANEVLRDGATFSSAAYSSIMGPVMGRTILEMDEPEHHAYRALVQQAFTRRALDRWREELIGAVVDEAIDAFAADGRADLVRQLTFPFPVRVIAGLLGLPAADLARFHRLSIELISFTFAPERGLQASAELRDYFAQLLVDRRRSPSDDLISALAGAELDGQRLTDDEIFAFLRLLLPAGAETTYRSSSNLLVGLLSDRSQWVALLEDRSLVPAAIEEGLRWECPLTSATRLTTTAADVAGLRVPAGSVVTVGIGAANRDPSRWDDPDRFDISREPRPHLAFVSGAHTCLGMHLARLETAVVLERLLDRLPDLALDPAVEVAVTGSTFRAPRSLPVVFAPEAGRER